ncbi:hypothetical protein QTO34_013120 [Cnephaeus nilssonii]|uniref:Uncharacterized protein n=1 Tax=Cnephaeus nilssonii TaxID=3371016 RepID=A0AA40I7N3_CNENI|nr:hypothetical protein QTO34_013120 [Eptesicus nilssonii]
MWVPVLPPTSEEGQPFLVYVSFSTSDLYNWKTQNPPIPEKPQTLIGLLESVFHTHWQTWDDCQQLLFTLFTSKKRDRIWLEARKTALGPGGGSLEENQGRVEEVFTSLRPHWDPNSVGGRAVLDTFHHVLLSGIKASAPKPTNLSKVSEVTQGPQESPTAFLEHLCKAYRVYIPIDPYAPENQRALNLSFVTQSAPDIRKKLKKLEGFQGMDRSQLIEVAQKVFNNRDSPGEKQDKRLARAVVAALKEMNLQRKRVYKKINSKDIDPGGKPVSFLVDTGATYFVLTKPMGPVTTKKTSVQGATGKSTLCPWTSKRTVDLGKSTVTQSVPTPY